MSLVERYHAKHMARLARMGGNPLPPRITQPLPKAEIPKRIVWRGINPAPYWRTMWFWELIALTPKPQNQFRPTIKRIINVVAAHYNVTHDDIISPRRHLTVTRPRQIVMYLARQLTLRSFPEIGRAIGGRDHTTVLYGVSKITKMMAKSPEMKTAVDELTKEIMAP